MTKWYFDTIEEAKAAMTGCDAIYTPGEHVAAGNALKGKFTPTVRGLSLSGFFLDLNEGGWIKVEDLEEVSALDLIPFIKAHASGEKVSSNTGGQWRPCGGVFVEGSEYRIEPKTILVNGFEVPEPMREAPKEKTPYFTICVSHPDFFREELWFNNDSHVRLLKRGICHATKQAAIAHAKAMLGIDPKGEE